MEDKRILLVSAAVGVFLLIIVGTALVLYAPPKNGDTRLTALSAETAQSWTVQPQNASEARDNPSSPENRQEQGAALQNMSSSAVPSTVLSNTAGTDAGTSAETAGIVQSRDLTVISNNTTVYTKDGLTTIDLSSLAERPEQKPLDTAQGMQAAADAKTLVPISPSEYMNTANSTGTASAVSAKPKTTAAAKTDTSKKAETQTKSAQPKTGTKKTASKPSQKPVDRYWVQAASFTDKMNAEAARSLLADEKIPAEVFTYQDKKGLTYYRLRVGPYTTESEAEYWNSRIKLIDNFASTQSYVTNSTKAAK